MDAVITYVNCNENFIQEYEKYVQKELEVERYRSYDTLDLQIKLIRKYLPFVKNIFVIVSNKEQVEGVDTSDAIIITHEDIIPLKYLPCFNSCTIEMFFHKIPNLSEEFIYFNDDVFPIDYLKPTDFFIYHKPLYNPKTYTLEKDNDKLYLFNLNNSTVLAAKILRKENDYKDKYIKYAHSTIPLLKSSYELTWQFERNQILASLTRTRHRKNYNTTLFNNYNYLLDKFIHKDIRSTYLNLASGIDKIIDTILYKPTPIVCINDVGEHSFSFDTFKKELRNAFEMNLLDTQPKKEIVKKEEPKKEIKKETPKKEEPKKQNTIVQTIKNISNNIFSKEVVKSIEDKKEEINDEPKEELVKVSYKVSKEVEKPKEEIKEVKEEIKKEDKEEIKEKNKKTNSIKSKIVVTFTSWKARIYNCKSIIECLLQQTVKPDLIYLNLSITEFPNKENDLPYGLVNIISQNNICKINWVLGKNTKTFKKVFPILQYLNDDDIIFCIDDDILYPNDYIKSRLIDFKNNNYHPLSGVYDCNKSFLKKYLGIYPNYGAACVIQKKMLNNWEKFIDDEIINTYNDDTSYAIIEYLNGYIPANITKYSVYELAKNYKFNEIEPSGKKLYNPNEYLKIYKNKIEKYINIQFNIKNVANNLLGYFNKPYNKLIVAFTSWSKRIYNCKDIIISILNQTLKPDIIYLNLSIAEFPNKEKDLPIDLLNLSKNEKTLIINWVDGENTKTFKKVFPILPYLNDDDLIFWTDDDIILPENILKSRVDDFIKYNKPISGISKNQTPEVIYKKIFDEVFNLNHIVGSTACSMAKVKMLKGFEYIKTDKIISFYNDDTIYVMLCYLNGYTFQPCSDYSVWPNKKIDKNTVKFMWDGVALSKSVNNNYYQNSLDMLKEVKLVLEKNKHIILSNSDFKLSNYFSIIKPNVIIYSCCLNNKEHKDFPKIKFNDDNLTYIMYSDDKSLHDYDIIDGWTIVKPKTKYTIVQNINKDIKWHPFDLFKNNTYDISIYMDSKVDLLINPNNIILDVIDKLKYGFTCSIYDYKTLEHPDNCNDIYKHIDYLLWFFIKKQKNPEYKYKDNMLKWKGNLLVENYPENSGVLETAVVLTNLHNKIGNDLENQIFNKYCEINTLRDQIAVPYVLWKNNIIVKECGVLGNYCSDKYYFRNNLKTNVNGR